MRDTAGDTNLYTDMRQWASKRTDEKKRPMARGTEYGNASNTRVGKEGRENGQQLICQKLIQHMDIPFQAEMTTHQGHQRGHAPLACP